MKAKQIIKNIIISTIIGILLGTITEYALILNIKWLTTITQSFVFWGIIICISAFIPKDYPYSVIDPIIVMSVMSGTYYMIRLIISGYTNLGGFKLFAFTGIAGSIYIGTFIYILKRMKIYHKKDIFPQVCYFISMTIAGIILSIIANINHLLIINHNMFYNIDLGIVIGFIIGIVIVRLSKKRNNSNEGDSYENRNNN